jgi:DNA-binding MarR family transcriptional regulator
MIRYSKIAKHPRIFLRLFGIELKEFEIIVNKLEKIWDEKVIKKYKRPGRNYKLNLEQMLLMLLLYYRTYSTMMQIGFMFNIDESRVSRIINKLEPFVAGLVAIEKNRELSYEEAVQLIDVTEQIIERPVKKQKEYFSGKKRRHTLKTEIRVNSSGQIRNVSKSHKGKIHDFKIHKASDHLPIGTKVYADSGYQGLRKKHKNAKTPIKKKRNKPLTYWQKKYNYIIAKRRIKVENIIAQLKNFRILSHRYRNKRKGYNLKFNIIAGIVNFKNGFTNKLLAA